ncbi:MAG: hypothetical protein ABUS47_12780 [Steroidobacter sp.]
MFKKIAIFTIATCMLSLTGCMTITASRYDSNPANAEHLTAEHLVAVNVAPITVQKGSTAKVKSIGLRAATYVAPSGSFCDYIHDALVDELNNADLIDDKANTIIDGLLIKNDVDIAGFSKGKADISVKFTVKRDGNTVFDKVISAHTEWPSSFLGDIAISRGASNYPLAVRELVGNLVNDADFLKALKKD